MAANYNDGIPLRKSLAMGGSLPTGDFGVEKLASVEGSVKPSNKMLGDGERAATPPINGNQANPNHGYKGR